MDAIEEGSLGDVLEHKGPKGRAVRSRNRQQSGGEEIANSVSHGLGFLLALAAAPFLILETSQRNGAELIGPSVFIGSAALLYLTSTLYHALPPSRAKDLFHVLDHCAIFILIAGTYTPFSLGVLRGPWGWTILTLVWSIALGGIALKMISGVRYPRISLGLYLAMGWVIIIAIKPLWLLMPSEGLFWLFLGGLAYTGGTVFYAAKRLRYGHLVWHLFVLAGTVFHFETVLHYAS